MQWPAHQTKVLHQQIAAAALDVWLRVLMRTVVEHGIVIVRIFKLSWNLVFAILIFVGVASDKNRSGQDNGNNDDDDG